MAAGTKPPRMASSEQAGPSSEKLALADQGTRVGPSKG